MKPVCVVLSALALVLNSCKKEMSVPQYDSASPASFVPSGLSFPELTKTYLPFSLCISSYDELIQVLGSSQAQVSSVILANGVTIMPGTDLRSITYNAEPQTQPNSLFGSKLTVEWRWPGGNWQLNTNDVWSLGCVYEVTGQPPYTNLIKGGEVIQINTCFFWETDIHTGERIDYVIID